MVRDIGEKIVEKFHPHWIGYLNYYFGGIFTGVLGIILTDFWFLIPLGILIFIFGEVLRKSETYYVLESGVAKGFLFFSSHRKVVLYKNIQNIEIYQSFIERLFGIGNVGFDTSGSHEMEVEFKFVDFPYRIERLVREKMNS